MPENVAGSVAARAPTPEAGHSCGTTVLAKSGQISPAFSGHPSTQLQHPPRYPRAAHKQQTCRDHNIVGFFPPLTPRSKISVLPPTSHVWTCSIWPFLVSCHMLTLLQDCQVHAPPKNWETFDQSTLLGLKINCHKSIKIENTRPKQHNNPENMFLNFTGLPNLIWIGQLNYIFCHRPWLIYLLSFKR